MDRVDCDWYEPISRSKKICKHFNGDEQKKRDMDRCRFKCSIMESKRLMEEDREVDRRGIDI